MAHQDHIDQLKDRIAQAQSECNTWRVEGPEEKYLEAYVIVKALELELEEQLRQPAR